MLDIDFDLNSGGIQGITPAAPLMRASADRAIAAMRGPRDMHIICVDVTNRCDLRCSNCTRLLANQAQHWDMTPENFRAALQSLDGYPGVIAMIGGNPCLHRQFAELCRIFAEEIPEKRQRGLWSNNVFDHQQLIADTFGFFNLNPHGDERGAASLEKLRALIPDLHYYRGNSHHAPLLAAMRDVIPDEAQMWDAIAKCDINRNWSASIVQNNGALRAYFCEVAASFDLARGEDHGAPVVPGWWRGTAADFSGQVKHFCPGCGVPARLAARLDVDETDDYSASNATLALKTRGKRKTALITTAERSTRAVTDYSAEHRQTAPAVTISVVIPCYNAAATIGETIASVLSQRVPDSVGIEVVVADDGSTDDSRAVAERSGAWFLSAPGNTGPAAARNRGLHACRGDFVAFLDADDTYAPGFFEAALHAFQQQPLAAVVCNVELVNCHRQMHPVQFQAMVFSLPSNALIRRPVVDAIGGFPEDAAFRGAGAGEDVSFKQMLSAFFQVGFVDHPFLRYRVQRGSHFDLFLDSSTVVNGQLQFTSLVKEDADGTRPAALAAYARNVAARLQAIDMGRKPMAAEARQAA